MRNLHKAGAAVGGAIALACVFIQPWEGLWTTAKVDRIGTGHPVTWCYGETLGGAKVGDHFTPAQCSKMLTDRLPRYNEEISKCIHVPISDKTRAAFISFAYNVGSTGFCRSMTARLLNAGNAKGACNAMMAWTHASGRVVQGLVNRRAAERRLCMEGLK